MERVRERWRAKACGCVKAQLFRSGTKVMIRCERHRGKPSKKRLLCYIDSDGIVRAET